MNKNLCTTFAFLDMSRAFDLVAHGTTSTKLERNVIRGPVLSWLQSHLKYPLKR